MAPGVAAKSSPLVVINAAGLRSGGGLTYLLAIVPELAAVEGIRWRVLISATQKALLDQVRGGPELLVLPTRGTLERMLWEQLALPRSRRLVPPGAVLVNAGNFGQGATGRHSVLIAHNALHFAELSDQPRLGLQLRAESILARRNARRADVTVAPSQAMAARIRAHAGVSAAVLPFGPGLAARWEQPADSEFLFVHRTSWGPHKRLGVLLEAVRELASRRYGQFHLVSACDPRTTFAERWPQARADTLLLTDPIVAAHVTIKRYAATDQELLRGHAAVVPSDLESFCFPLAEAVALGVPTVAADVAFARELCGEAAFYAQPGDASSLSSQMERLLDGDRPRAVSADWKRRVSWKGHVEGLADLCRTLAT